VEHARPSNHEGGLTGLSATFREPSEVTSYPEDNSSLSPNRQHSIPRNPAPTSARALWDNFRSSQQPFIPCDSAAMTLLHLILWALYPMMPVLRLKAMLSGLIAVLARTLGDEETLAWLADHPWHPKGLRLIEGSIAVLEDMIQALVYHCAREILGLPASQLRRASRLRPTVLAGSPRPLGEILLRFERSLWVLRNHEHFARKRAARLARLLAQSSLELEVIHHPLPPLVVVVMASSSSSVFAPAGFSARRIRAPP